MPATVLAFPTQIETVCDSCHRATHENDLSTFDCCEARVCRKCHECDCESAERFREAVSVAWEEAARAASNKKFEQMAAVLVG